MGKIPEVKPLTDSMSYLDLSSINLDLIIITKSELFPYFMISY